MRTNLDDLLAVRKEAEHAEWMAKEGAAEQKLNPESFAAIAKRLREIEADINKLIPDEYAGEFDFTIDSVEVA